MNKNTDSKTIISRKTFLDLCAAASSAREWMAVQAPANAWANRVRTDLFNAHSAAVAEQSANIAVLELAAQAESLLNLYMEAKRELHMHTGLVGMDVAKFPVVENIRAQIKVVRESIGGAE